MTTLRSSPAVRAGAAFLASRLLLALSVLVMAGLAGEGAVDHEWATGTWWLDRFSAWDSYHFVRIATLGYLPPGLDCCDQAYFPGYPVLMAALAPVTGGNVTGAGLLVSLVAGAVAARLLWRLVADDARGGPQAARRAAAPSLLWHPAGSSSSPSTPRRCSSPSPSAPGCSRAGDTGGGPARSLPSPPGCASTASSSPPAWPSCMPCSGTATGGLARAGTCSPSDSPPSAWAPTWLTSTRAPGRGTPGARPRHRGWDRSTATPWTGITAAWRALLDSPNAWLAASRAADIAAVLLGVAVCILLARQRRWPELTYLTLTVGVVLCSTLWVSAPRYALPGSPPTWPSRRCGTGRHTDACMPWGWVCRPRCSSGPPGRPRRGTGSPESGRPQRTSQMDG